MNKVLASVLCLPLLAPAAPNNPATDWFSEAKYGVFMHLLPGNETQFAQVKSIDAAGIAQSLQDMGAGYFVITLGQNSGYFISPNATYDRVTGYAPGERTSARDLPLDLFQALQPRDIKLMLYLPCQAPNRDARAQRTFGLPEGPKDQPIQAEFATKWSAVIQEWSDRYGERVAGWWFDGGYGNIHFNEEIAGKYAAAAKHGNPKSIVTFNPGVRLIHHTSAEDYTAGELRDPFGVVPTSRWLKGSQWHALTFAGGYWGRRDVRHTDEQWIHWIRAVTDQGGVVTMDLGPNWDVKAGPIGGFAATQVNQMKAIKAAIRAP